MMTTPTIDSSSNSQEYVELNKVLSQIRYMKNDVSSLNTIISWINLIKRDNLSSYSGKFFSFKESFNIFNLKYSKQIEQIKWSVYYIGLLVEEIWKKIEDIDKLFKKNSISVWFSNLAEKQIEEDKQQDLKQEDKQEDLKQIKENFKKIWTLLENLEKEIVSFEENINKQIETINLGDIKTWLQAAFDISEKDIRVWKNFEVDEEWNLTETKEKEWENIYKLVSLWNFKDLFWKKIASAKFQKTTWEIKTIKTYYVEELGDWNIKIYKIDGKAVVWIDWQYGLSKLVKVSLETENWVNKVVTINPKTHKIVWKTKLFLYKLFRIK